jgi:hypothetical protein
MDTFGHDRYTASRWGQAFAAHQALGVLLDEFGDDRYTIRQGGGQSMAWEESVTALVDVDGDDVYAGGRFYGQAAACHNSVALFNDQAGTDSYEYEPGPGLAGPNDYHGGTSLALFVDEGGGADRYRKGENDAIFVRDAQGFFVDLPGDLHAALRDSAFKSLLR